mgnify:CR=1 FL=1
MTKTKLTKYAGTLYLEKDFYDDLADLGWDYTAGRMSRSGMQVYDTIMTRLGVLEDGEHWNEDCYNCLLYTSDAADE